MSVKAKAKKSGTHGGGAVHVTTPPPPLRVLVVSHLHPALAGQALAKVSQAAAGQTEAQASAGNGPAYQSVAAAAASYQLFDALKALPGVEAFLLAGNGDALPPPLGVAIFQPFGGDEYVFTSAGYDAFLHSARDASLLAAVEELLADLQPDVVYFSELGALGLEVILCVKRVLPKAKLVMRLHQSLAACAHLQPPAQATAQGLRSCPLCLPERDANDIFLRDIFLKRFLAEVDQFVSASAAVLHSAQAWGVDASRCHLIADGVVLPAVPPVAPAKAQADRPLVFGFFGQFAAQNGAVVLLQAVALLRQRPELQGRYRITCHGSAGPLATAWPEGPPQMAIAGDDLQFHGAYAAADLPGLLQSCDAVVVPSLGSQHSPQIVAAAFAHGRPVLCAAEPRLTEQVTDGRDGFVFTAAQPQALADLIDRLCRAPHELSEARAQITPPSSIAQSADALLTLFLLARATDVEANAA